MPDWTAKNRNRIAIAEAKNVFHESWRIWASLSTRAIAGCCGGGHDRGHLLAGRAARRGQLGHGVHRQLDARHAVREAGGDGSADLGGQARVPGAEHGDRRGLTGR